MELSSIQNLDIAQMNTQKSRNDKVLRDISKTGDKKKIRKLAEEFESIFLEIMLKSMRETIPKSELLDAGNAEDIFRSMLDTQYAKLMASQRQTGIADNIEKQLLSLMNIKEVLK